MEYKNHFKNFLQSNAQENASINNENSEQTPQHELKSKTDIVFENDSLKLIVEKTFFKRQKNFKMLDELFLFKVKQKSDSTKWPLLSEILDFLHAAILHVLDSIKSFYIKDHHNIAYLTIHQEKGMTNGLNTGILFKIIS